MKMDIIMTINYLMIDLFCTLVHYYGHQYE